MANWNVTVGNISTTLMTIHWPNLAPLINEHVLYYVALISQKNGSQYHSVVVSGNKSLAHLVGLLAYTQYQVSVIGVDSDGQSYSSSNVTVRTDEGGIHERLFTIIIIIIFFLGLG